MLFLRPVGNAVLSASAFYRFAKFIHGTSSDAPKALASLCDEAFPTKKIIFFIYILNVVSSSCRERCLKRFRILPLCKIYTRNVERRAKGASVALRRDVSYGENFCAICFKTFLVFWRMLLFCTKLYRFFAQRANVLTLTIGRSAIIL